MKNTLVFLFAMGLSCLPAAAGVWKLDLETGVVGSGYNDVRIPGNTGTKFSLSEDLSTAARGFFRVTIIRDLSERSSIALLIAPLTLDASGAVQRPILFYDSTFPAGTPLNARYRFDSYRLSYRYIVHRSDRIILRLGGTAKIRDAAIRIEGGGLSAEKKNTGLVPLIYFGMDAKLSDRTGIIVEGDALAAPQGRAEDLLVAGRYILNDRVTLKAGYRLLEGGADNDEVYNFTLLNYMVIGAAILF